MMKSDELEIRVNNLPYDDLVEAANFYFPEAIGIADLQGVEDRLVEIVEKNTGEYSNLVALIEEVKDDEQSIEYLLRAALLKAAHGTEDERRRLGEALDGVGKSQVVVDVVYAILAATTALGMLWLAKPPREVRTKSKRETRPDGSEIETTETVTKEVPLPVDKLFAWIKLLTSKNILGDDKKSD